jgi:antitoxin component YwqK of YwqJK toxin-antitoxin module
MKFKLILFIAFLCCNITFGQNPIEDIQYFENGKIQSKKTYILGEEDKNLTIEEYYSSGKLSSKVIMSFDGNYTEYIITEYFENGKLKLSGSSFTENSDIRRFVSGNFYSYDFSKEGTWVEYYENGQLHYEADFEDNKKVGEWITYFENGQIESKGVYEEGEKKGEWITYFETGIIESKKYYQ